MTDRQDALPQNAALLKTKVDGILASAPFLRAPILSRLLRYLLDQTLAGEADNLKAYTVAVEGLDRSPDFDAQFDSYPRVQMVRLRKALEGYYADAPLLPEPYVYLCARSYRLELASCDVAYPNVARALFAGATSTLDGSPVPSAVRSAWFSGRVAVFCMGFALAAMIALVVVLLRSGDQTARRPATSSAMQTPVIEISVDDVKKRGGTDELKTILFEALTRSWVTLARDPSVQNARVERPPSYRITLRENGRRVDAQLVDSRTGLVLWTDSVDHGTDPGLRDHLVPVIAELVGPFGVIARTETARLTPYSSGSYACVLRYFAFVKGRDAQEKARVSKCLEQPVDEPQLVATLDALRSFFTLESEFGADGDGKIAIAERFAQRAEEADAEDPYARFAKSRLALIQSNCAAGLFYADRAITANPYDSMIVTMLAGLAAPCSPERASDMLDKAYRIRNDNDVTMRSSLIFATIAQGQEHRLSELGFLSRPPTGPQLPGYLLTESLIAASAGHRTQAAAMWKELRSLPSTPKISDDNLLKSIILSDTIRARVLRLLREGGAVTA